MLKSNFKKVAPNNAMHQLHKDLSWEKAFLPNYDLNLGPFFCTGNFKLNLGTQCTVKFDNLYKNFQDFFHFFNVKW